MGGTVDPKLGVALNSVLGASLNSTLSSLLSATEDPAERTLKKRFDAQSAKKPFIVWFLMPDLWCGGRQAKIDQMLSKL